MKKLLAIFLAAFAISAGAQMGSPMVGSCPVLGANANITANSLTTNLIKLSVANPDAGISRLAAGSIAFGNGTASDASAIINAGSEVIGGALGYVDTNVLASWTGTANSFVQMIIRNKSNGATASSDMIVNNDVSTATTFYGDFGMNSSGFAGSGAFNAPSNVFLTSTSSDLAIGTTTSNAIRFVINNGATDAANISTAGLLSALTGFTVSGGAVSMSPANFSVTVSPTGTGTITVNPAAAGTLNNVSLGATTPLAVTSTVLTATGAVALSPANANVVISPTGTGVVTVNPATAGTLNNVSIGQTTPLAGTFTTAQATTYNIGASGPTLVQDAAAVSALKNSTTAQAVRVYGTTTGPKYISVSHDGTNGLVDTAASSGQLNLGTTNATGTQIGAQLGVGAAPVTTAGITATQTALTGVSQMGINVSETSTSAATTKTTGVSSTVATAASAYTSATVANFEAVSQTKGATSTITSSIGFLANNAIAVGTNNAGFQSGVNAATNTYAFYGQGTAASLFSGNVGIGVNPNTIAGLYINTPTFLTGTDQYGQIVDITSTTSATASTEGIAVNLRTTASAYTTTDMVAFNANLASKGAGSTITNSKGFWAKNAIAVGTNNYGFFCDIATATTTWCFYSSSTAPSLLTGSLTTSAYIAGGSTPTLTGTCTTGSQVGGNTAGKFTATCTAQTVIITFATTAPNGWVCNAQDITTSADTLKQTAFSTTTCTLTGTTVASDVILFDARAF